MQVQEQSPSWLLLVQLTQCYIDTYVQSVDQTGQQFSCHDGHLGQSIKNKSGNLTPKLVYSSRRI